VVARRRFPSSATCRHARAAAEPPDTPCTPPPPPNTHTRNKQTLALLEKRRAGQKRKLAALQDSLAERVADAEARLAKLTSSAAKQRNISDVLKCLMPSADQD
jgi:hypothetical protein